MMEKPCACILSETLSLPDLASLDVVLATSIAEAKTIFRAFPISCLVVSSKFKDSRLKSFLEWFRGHFPKVLLILFGKKHEDELSLKKDANLILLPSSHPIYVMEAAAQALQERKFTLDLNAVWPEVANASSPWVRKVLRYLLENDGFLRIKSAQEVADHFGVAESYLLRNFDPYFPLSLKQFLLCLKLCHAAWLKDTTTLHVETIASTCSFANGSHLSHVAHKELGMPLSSFLTSHSWQKVLPWVIDNSQRTSVQEKGKKNKVKIRQRGQK